MVFDPAATQLDTQQVLQQSFDKGNGALKMMNLAGNLVPSVFNEIDLGYTGSNVTTVTYKNNGSTVATLTLVYDMSNNLQSVTRS